LTIFVTTFANDNWLEDENWRAVDGYGRLPRGLRQELAPLYTDFDPVIAGAYQDFESSTIPEGYWTGGMIGVLKKLP
jgi:hypothetical protein